MLNVNIWVLIDARAPERHTHTKLRGNLQIPKYQEFSSYTYLKHGHQTF